MSADTTGHLTDAERVMLADASEHTTDAACWNITRAGSLPWVVARIKADAIAAERERIARAIGGIVEATRYGWRSAREIKDDARGIVGDARPTP